MLKTMTMALTAALLLAGCAGNPPTAEGFREVSRGGHMLVKAPESFVVDRPLAAVAAAWRKKAPECLEFNAYSQHKVAAIGTTSSPRLYATSKATVVATAQKAELHLQVQSKGNLAYEPEGGAYMFVADAEAVGPGRTRIDIYRTAVRSDLLYGAVRGWAEGSTQGCPDPKSFM